MDQAEKLRQLINHKPNKGFKFKVITVSSGKGGVGKTNLVINLASLLSSKGLRVAILDADFGMANVDILYGIKSRYSIYDLLYKGKTINEVITSTSDGVMIIPGGSGIRELVDLSEENKHRLVEEFSKLENIDILLVDTGAGLSSTVLNFIEVADEVVIITNSEPTALTDAYGLIKVIIKYNLTTNINVVINRVRNIKDARETFDKLDKTVTAFLGRYLKYLGFIVEDNKVGQAVREQKPFVQIYPRSEASLCINRIVSELLGNENAVRNNSVKDYFSKLFRVMGR